MEVLVGYATRYGATRGIAEFVGDRLRQGGIVVDVREITTVKSVDNYSAFVVGAAAYMGGWLKEAKDFVKRNSRVLSTKPVWLFSSGPVGAEKVDQKGNDVLAAARPKDFDEFEDLVHPRDMAVFYGALYGDKLKGAIGFAFRMAQKIPAAKRAMPEGDYREWNVIGAWADGIAASLEVGRLVAPNQR